MAAQHHNLHFQDVNEFKQFVENGFRTESTTRASTFKMSNISSTYSEKDIVAMKTTAQTRKEIQLLKKVRRDNNLAARVVNDTQVAKSLLEATSTEISPSKALSEEMRRRRIVQVREQEKLWAASTNRRRREIQQQVRSNMDQDAKENWEREQAERKKHLRQRYTEALASIGKAQKSAVSLQRGLRTTAREQMGAWQSTNEQHNELHRQAVKGERASVTSYQQKVFDSELRDRIRIDVSDKQREEAHRYQAILQAAEAANRYVDQQRVELDYTKMGMDRRVETAVYDHGGGATDFSTTRIHHRVVRHQRPSTSPNTLSKSGNNRGGAGGENHLVVSSRTTRQIPFVKRTGGRPRDGPGAVAARRAEHLREAEEKIRKRRLQEERAQQRYRTASGKLHMKREYDLITSQLEQMEYDKRQRRAREITSRNRHVGGAVGASDNITTGRSDGNDSRDIEDQFERMFVDDRLTSVDLSGVVHVNDSQDVHLEDLQYLHGIDATEKEQTEEVVYVRDMSEERREQEARMNAARKEQLQTLEEARRRRMQQSTLSSSSSSSSSLASTVVLPRATALGMSSFHEGPPMEGDELEEYLMSEKEGEDLLGGVRASRVKISRNGSIEIILDKRTTEKLITSDLDANSATTQQGKEDMKVMKDMKAVEVIKDMKEEAETAATTAAQPNNPSRSRRFTQILSDIQLVGRDEDQDEDQDANKNEEEQNSPNPLDDLLQISQGLSKMAQEMTTHPKSPGRGRSVIVREEEEKVANLARNRSSIHMMGDLALVGDDDDDDDDDDDNDDDENGGVTLETTLYNPALPPTLTELGLLPGDLDPTPLMNEEMSEEIKDNGNVSFLETDSLEGTPQKDLLGRGGNQISVRIRESPMGTQNMEGGWTSSVYTQEQQDRYGVDAMGEVIKTNMMAATTEEKKDQHHVEQVAIVAASVVKPVGGAATRALPPAWVTNGLEPPAGEVDMDGWTSAVYTIEQQERLNVNQLGVQREVIMQSRRDRSRQEEIEIENVPVPPMPMPAAPTPSVTMKVVSGMSLEPPPSKTTKDETSKKLAQLAARSKARQTQLAKRRAERKVQKERTKMREVTSAAVSPYAAAPKIKNPTSMATKSGKRAVGLKKKSTSYMTSPSLSTAMRHSSSPNGGVSDAYGGKRTSTGVTKKKKRVKQKTLEELEKVRKHEARERRRKMKELDAVSFVWFFELEKNS
jgi:hypothetical protein